MSEKRIQSPTRYQDTLASGEELGEYFELEGALFEGFKNRELNRKRVLKVFRALLKTGHLSESPTTP